MKAISHMGTGTAHIYGQIFDLTVVLTQPTCIVDKDVCISTLYSIILPLQTLESSTSSLQEGCALAIAPSTLAEDASAPHKEESSFGTQTFST
jgi:hypothetical protein